MAKAILTDLVDAARPFLDTLSPSEQRMTDYALVIRHDFPAYLGGPPAQAAAS